MGPVAVRARAGSWVTAKRLTKEYGFGVLYRGFMVNSVREFLFGSVYWGGYETCKTGFTKEFTAIAGGPSALASTLAIVCAGSVSGMSGWLISMPFDIIKTNIQGAADLNLRVSSFQSARTQIITFGWGGLYRGLVPTLVRASIVSAVRFSAYEAALKLYDSFVADPNSATRRRIPKVTHAPVSATSAPLPRQE
jgi:hypothetical protein